MRYGLAISLALNLFLLTTIVAARVDATREPAQAPESRFRDLKFGTASPDSEPLGGIEDLARRLERTGLGSRDIKRLIVSWLSARYADAASPAVPNYWQSSYRPGLTQARRQVEIERQIRDSLVDFYGTEAATDPAFEPVFRPLGPDYDFLSSSAQLELQNYQLDALAARDSIPTPIETPALCKPVSTASNRPAQPSLPESLDALDAIEFRLRFSPLAQQLRDSVDTDDEHYFRSLFDRLVALEYTTSPQDQASIRQDLRTQMGDPTFDRFWSSRDPLFAPVRNYLRSQGFTAQQIFAAYGIVNRSQERLLVAVASTASEESMLGRVQQIRSDESAALVRLLGDESAAGLNAATTRAAMSFSRASPADC
jgi:hypothetical protein